MCEVFSPSCWGGGGVGHPLNGLFLFFGVRYETEKSLGIADDAFALKDKPKASERLRI